MDRPINADSLWVENGILKNKQGITDQNELDQIEEKIVKQKLAQIKIKEFNKNSLINLHKNLYEDLYNFAGKLRNENVVYNDIMACQYEIIDMCLTDLFNADYSNIDFTKTFTYLLSELYIILPFRDGNRETINKFLEDYAESKGYKVLIPQNIKKEIKAAYYGDISKLYNIISSRIEPTK